ncbi:uncharacterized protein LOC135137479 isoform X2 [Zophobas morio]|uniref:uncharacterized protein LOC135137479 isoform X2 n=1 Tax=Zophobas morio TaxID=2755281 RepID=UPI0030839C03
MKQTLVICSALLRKMSAVERIATEYRKYLPDLKNATKKTAYSIEKEAKYITIFVNVHLALVVITGFVLIPIGKERQFHFTIAFLEDYCNLPMLEVFYYIIFPVSALQSVRLSHALLYFVSHIKFGIYVFLDFMKDMCSDYDNKDDNELLELKEYQHVIKELLVSTVIRVNHLNKITNNVCDVCAEMIPAIVISGFLMGLSAMSFAYLGGILGYWCYFQNFMWCVSTVSVLLLYTQCGQEFENMTEKLFDVLWEIRWTSFDRSNRKIFLLTMVALQEPKKLSFTETVSCNYELGVQVSKVLYSFAALMAKLRIYHED